MSAGVLDLLRDPHYDLRAYAENLAAAEAVAALIEAARKLIAQIDTAVADREGDNMLTDTGCIDCTLGTVPDWHNTGCCGYHATVAALARVSP